MIALLASLAFAADPADSPLFSGSQTPWTIGKKNGAFGLFRAVTIGIDDKTEISANGLAFFLAPTPEFKREVWEHSSGFMLSAGGELGFPTPALRMLQTGFLQPIGADQTVPWTLVPGASFYIGWRNEQVAISSRLHFRAGIPLTDRGDKPLEFQDVPWLDPWISPLVNGWSLSHGIRIDWTPNPGWVITGQGRIEYSGGPDLAGRVFVLRAIGNHVAVGLGFAMAWEKFRYGFHDWNEETPASPPVIPLDGMPLFDVQGRW